MTPPGEDMTPIHGEFGYRLYKGSDYLGFTKDTSMVLKNVSDPNGTYRIAAAYANTAIVDSLGVTAPINYTDNSNYEVQWLVPSNKEYHLNDNLTEYDSSPSISDIKLLRDGEEVTPSVKISIKDKADNNIANISTSSANEYKVTYVLSYKTYHTTVYRTVKVIDNTSQHGENEQNGQ